MATKVKQKPAQKVGGGDYFDGNIYRSGEAGGVLGFGGGTPLTKSQYEQALKNHEQSKAREAKFTTDLAQVNAAAIIGHLAQRQQANAASTAQQAQTTGLINSGTSAFDANQLPDNSIAGMMKT